MTKEELLELVNKKVDTSKFKSLSKRSIDEELVEALEEIGDDESANDKVVTKLANRLKRMDGNLHANVSAEVRKAKEEAERKAKEEKGENGNEGGEGGNAGNQSEEFKALLARVEKMEQEAKERDAKAARKAVLASVKEGLKSKFGAAKIEMNDFFAEIALGKLEIGDEPDVADLITKAESIYTADMKKAGLEPTSSKPRDTNGGGGGDDHIDEHEFDDIVARFKD